MSLHFSINRQSFHSLLKNTLKAIPSRAVNEILYGVKLVIDEKLTLTGANGSIAIETFLNLDDEKANLQVYEKGGIILPAKFLSSTIQLLPEEEFTLEVLENAQVRITSGKADFEIHGIDVENYPRLREVYQENPLKLPIHIWTKLIHETVFASSIEESKPILTGVHFKSEEGKLKAVATDSRRLSQRKIVHEGISEEIDMVIPGKSLRDLTSIFTNEEEMITISVSDNQVLFSAENIKYYSNLLEGLYPDTDRLIPTEFLTSVTFNVKDLRYAMERASLISHEGRNNIVKLQITSSGVTLFGTSQDIGRSEEELNPENIQGDDLIISFNPDYMKEALRAFGEVNVEIHFVSSVRPFILLPTEDSDSFIQLVTPIRTA